MPVFTGGFPPGLCCQSWKYTKYSLRLLSRLDENPLRKNCKHISAHNMGKPRECWPPKCGTGPAPVALMQGELNPRSTPLFLASRHQFEPAAMERPRT